MLYLVLVVILSFMHITCTNKLFHICQASRDGSLFLNLLCLFLSLSLFCSLIVTHLFVFVVSESNMFMRFEKLDKSAENLNKG
jgi:hypothetical protein